MYTKINKISVALLLFAVLISSCKNLTEMNVNPNGVDPTVASPNLLMATVITMTGSTVIGMGYGDIAGVMQHTEYDGWSGGHNFYDWSDQTWSGNYATLRNADEMLKKSLAAKLDFQAGVAMLFKAYNFGIIADTWGDAPFSQALKGEQGSEVSGRRSAVGGRRTEGTQGIGRSGAQVTDQAANISQTPP